MNTFHETVELELDGKLVSVDKGISDLVRQCWRLGLKTAYSCQGGDANQEVRDMSYEKVKAYTKLNYLAYVKFVTHEDALTFIKYVGDAVVSLPVVRFSHAYIPSIVEKLRSL